MLEYMPMEQSHEAIHTDRHGSTFNFTMALSLAVGVIGLISTQPLLIIVGLGVAAFTWFTTPSQYVVYDDLLMIAYGRPRVKYIPFQQIGQIEMLKLPFGGRLRVRLLSGRQLLIQPRSLEEFQGKFTSALESYRRDHPVPPSDTPA